MARSAAKKAKTVLFLKVRFAAVAKMHNGAQNMPGRISHHKRLQTEHSLKIKRQKDQAEDHTKGNADTNTPQQQQFQTTRFSKPFERKEWTAQSRTVRSFFFLRLPYGQYGPVSQLSRSEESCTGPFNWGEAHCAGEKVKRKIGPFLWKSLKNQTRTRTQQKGRQSRTVRSTYSYGFGCF